MIGIAVNPATIQKGDSIAEKVSDSYYDPDRPDTRKVIGRPTKITSANFCPSAPEFFHLNGVCHDTRFATVVRVLD